jgi:hypothetical protein
MDGSERRILKRYNIRTPLRFRAIDLMDGKCVHFTQAINVSRGGFYFASTAPLKLGMPIEATLKMPSEITGGEARMTSCTARVVRVKTQAYKDGRVGFGMEIEKVHAAEVEDTAAAD